MAPPNKPRGTGKIGEGASGVQVNIPPPPGAARKVPQKDPRRAPGKGPKARANLAEKVDGALLAKLRANGSGAMEVVGKWLGKYQEGNYTEVNPEIQEKTGMTPSQIQRAVGAGVDQQVGPGTLALIAYWVAGQGKSVKVARSSRPSPETEEESETPEETTAWAEETESEEEVSSPEPEKKSKERAELEQTDEAITAKSLEVSRARSRAMNRSMAVTRAPSVWRKQREAEAAAAEAKLKKAEEELAKLEAKRKRQYEKVGTQEQGKEWLIRERQKELKAVEAEVRKLWGRVGWYWQEVAEIDKRIAAGIHKARRDRKEKLAVIDEVVAIIHTKDQEAARLRTEINKLRAEANV